MVQQPNVDPMQACQQTVRGDPLPDIPDYLSIISGSSGVQSLCNPSNTNGVPDQPIDDEYIDMTGALAGDIVGTAYAAPKQDQSINGDYMAMTGATGAAPHQGAEKERPDDEMAKDAQKTSGYEPLHFDSKDLDEPRELEKWLLTHDISKDTHECLKAQRILTLCDLRHMRESDIHELRLIRGDHIRLRVAIKTLHESRENITQTKV